jgi:arginyl-tRNA--protein-N-Asp/Glu arginylyltransferase
MITSKAQMLRVMKQCDGADTLTREEKFQVFVRVCDNMLKDGRMTKATHKRFTEIW